MIQHRPGKMLRAEIGDIFLARLLLQPQPALVDCLLQPQGAHVQVTHLSYAAAGCYSLCRAGVYHDPWAKSEGQVLGHRASSKNARRGFHCRIKFIFPRYSSQSRSGSRCCSQLPRARALAGVRAARPVGVAVRPVHLLRVSLPRVLESNFPGEPL